MADDGWFEVKMYYDKEDVSDSYRRGFWIGAVTGIASTFTLCILVGYFLVS